MAPAVPRFGALGSGWGTPDAAHSWGPRDGDMMGRNDGAGVPLSHRPYQVPPGLLLSKKEHTFVVLYTTRDCQKLYTSSGHRVSRSIGSVVKGKKPIPMGTRKLIGGHSLFINPFLQ